MTQYLYLLTIIFIIGCSESNENHKQLVQPSNEKPILLGIAYDISGSVNHSISPMDTSLLKTLALYIGKRKGVLSLGHITSNSYRPLMNYPFDINVVEVKGTLQERAIKNQKNIKAINKFSLNLTAFLSESSKKYLIARNKKQTDIDGSLERFRLLFQEPLYINYEKILIIISDGKDTFKKKIKSIPDDSKVLLVGWRDIETAQSIFNDCKVFESPKAVINFVINQI